MACQPRRGGDRCVPPGPPPRGARMGFIKPSPQPVELASLPGACPARACSHPQRPLGRRRVRHTARAEHRLHPQDARPLFRCRYLDHIGHLGDRVHRRRLLVPQHRRLPEAGRVADAAGGDRARRRVRAPVRSLPPDDRQHSVLDPSRNHPHGALGQPRAAHRRRRAHLVRRRALRRCARQPRLPAGRA